MAKENLTNLFITKQKTSLGTKIKEIPYISTLLLYHTDVEMSTSIFLVAYNPVDKTPRA